MRRDITAGEVTRKLLSDPAFLDGEYVFVICDGLAIPGFNTKLTTKKMRRMSSVQPMMQEYSGNPATLRYLTTKFEVSRVNVTSSRDTNINFVLFHEFDNTCPDLIFIL